MLYCFELALTLMWTAAMLPVAAATTAIADKAIEAKGSSLPVIRSLTLQPESLKLRDGRDERRVLVFGKTDQGNLIDLSSQAVLKSESTNVEIDAQGYIKAKDVGSAEITVTAAGQTTKLPVTV